MSDLVDRLHPRWYRDVAAMVLDRPTFAWVDAGAGSDRQASADVAAFQKQQLLPRVLRDVAAVSTTAEVTGGAIDLPIIAGPVGLQRLLHPDGEIGLVHGVHDSGSLTVVAASTSTSLADIRASCPDATLWLQLPNWSDRSALTALVEQAEAVGVAALLPLVNAPVAAAHVPAEVGFRLPPDISAVHASPLPLDPTLTADGIGWLVSQTDLPVIPKGVMHPDDARRLIDVGVVGLVVSNHGGRQLPRAIGALDALPAVAEAVGSGVPVYLDGGVRSGLDVFVASALGARAVMVGRPLAYGLTVGGRRGVARVLDQLRAELVETARLCGVAVVADADLRLIATTHGHDLPSTTFREDHTRW